MDLVNMCTVLRQAFFKPRSGGIITLYIDAHVEPGTTPVIKLPGGGTFSQSSLWTDIYSAMREAKHIIYIAGARHSRCTCWSFCSTIRCAVKDVKYSSAATTPSQVGRSGSTTSWSDGRVHPWRRMRTTWSWAPSSNARSV